VGYRIIRENIRPGGSNVRLDFLLVDDGNSLYLEVKSVTHVVDGFALFPDAPTLRGKRQLLEMLKLLKDGFEAGLMFSVQRPDATYIKPNCDVDPGFANLLWVSVEKGLKIFTLKAAFAPQKNAVIIWPNEPPFSLQ